MHISGRTIEATFPDRRPITCYVTDRRQLQGMSLLACVGRAIRWGTDFVQIREKDLPDRELYELTRKALSLARGTRCRILINGRADIALAAGAHGVHLPSTGLRIRDLHLLLRRGLIFGVSAHNLREAVGAAEQGAHYLLLGPVNPTQSKPAYGPPLGLVQFQRICAKVPIPVLALGGIQADSILPALTAGAAGIAGISLFQGDMKQLNAARRELLAGKA